MKTVSVLCISQEWVSKVCLVQNMNCNQTNSLLLLYNCNMMYEQTAYFVLATAYKTKMDCVVLVVTCDHSYTCLYSLKCVV